jgi:hypothetical protein
MLTLSKRFFNPLNAEFEWFDALFGQTRFKDWTSLWQPCLLC